MKSSQVQPDETSVPSSAGAVAPSQLPRAGIPSLAVQGKYSIERLLALEAYSRTKSYWHVLWVVIWTPLVPVLMILAYQLPPLASPEAGLRANWMYLVERGGLGAYASHEAVMVITCASIPELKRVLTLRTRIVLGGIFGCVYVSATVALANWWGFPVPFSASFINPICGMTGIVCLYLVVLPVLNQSNQLQRRFVKIMIYVMVFSCASLTYPAYIALFVFVGDHSPNYQLFVTLLALLIKFVLRKVIAYAFREWEDLIPVMVIFSVEFFSSLYQVVSIQASSSFLTTAFIIACDLVFTARSLWRLYDTTRSLQLLLQITKADVILPALTNLWEAPKRFRASSVIDHDKQRAEIIEATTTLFRTEILLLTEYLECMIPFFYAVNMVIIWLSPNAQYYSLTGAIETLDQLLLVLVNISVLFAVEVASFVLLNWILRKRLRFSPMHQVAFAMENHASTIRASMLFVLVLILHMNVVHTGVDFSFQFKWLHSNYSNSTSTNA